MKISPFSLLCLAAAINGGACGTGGAGGIETAYFACCEDVASFTFGSGVTRRQVTGFTMVPTKTWFEVRPAKNTGSETTPIVVTPVGGKSWTHGFTFSVANQNAANAANIYDLATTCCLYVIVKFKGGEYKLLGLHYNETTGEYSAADLTVGDGTITQSGQAAADFNGYVIAVSAEGVNNDGLLFASGYVASQIGTTIVKA